MSFWRNNNNTKVSLQTVAAAMALGDTSLFTIVGTIAINELFAECVTPNGAVISTLLYKVTTTVPAADLALSAASGSLISAAAGTLVSLNSTTLATALDIIVPGGGLARAVARDIITTGGILKATVATTAMSGTWKHTLSYTPISPGAYVS